MRLFGAIWMAERSSTIRSLLMRHESDSGLQEDIRVVEWSESERRDGLSVEWEGDDVPDATGGTRTPSRRFRRGDVTPSRDTAAELSDPAEWA